MDISSRVADFAQSTPTKTAIRFDRRAITYQDFELRVSRLAAGLTTHFGVAPGDRIAFLGQNSIELLQVLFACARVGAVFAPLSNRATAEQLIFFLRHLKPRWLIADSGFSQRAAEAAAGVPELNLALFDVGDGARNLLGDRGVAYSETAVDPKSTAIIVYTSGTTGTPKGVMHSHRGLQHGALNSIHAYRMTAADEVLAFIQLGHVGGLTIQTVPSLFVGATLNIHLDFEPGAVLREIERNRITLMVSRPHASKDLIAHPNWDRTDLSSLRSVNTGSTTVPLSTMVPWFERGVTVQHNFGMSEALPPALITSIDDARDKMGSIGKPALHVEAMIADDEMRDMPPGEVGQIVLRGASIFDGYWENPDATAAAFRDGWFLTGDLGHRDAEGYFYFDDRIKDVVKVNSYAVYTADVKRVLEECPAVEAAAVTGRPDEDTGEAVVAFVVLHPGYRPDRSAILALFEGRLAAYQTPTQIEFLDRLPLNQSGKIDRDVLRGLLRVTQDR